MDKINGKSVYKCAFTVAEVLIVLVIIGIIATLMLTSFKNLPDRNKSMFKKAYSVAEKTVFEMISDETLYPYHPEYEGFENPQQAEISGNKYADASKNVPNCKTTDFYKYRYTVSSDADCASGKKFDALFVDKLNILGFSDKCKDTNASVCFTTSDGIGWIIEKANFTGGGKKKITLDVNGFEKGPNTHIDDKNENGDMFEIYVDFDGKMTVEGDIEKKYLSEHSLQKD